MQALDINTDRVQSKKWETPGTWRKMTGKERFLPAMYGDTGDGFSLGLPTLIWRITPMISIVFGFSGILSLVFWIIFLRCSLHFEVVHTWYFGIWWVLSHSKFVGGHSNWGHFQFFSINCLHVSTHSKFQTATIYTVCVYVYIYIYVSLSLSLNVEHAIPRFLRTWRPTPSRCNGWWRRTKTCWLPSRTQRSTPRTWPR